MNAYITLLSDNNYLNGVLVLNRSLKAVKSKYKLYCLLSISMNEEAKESLEKEDIPFIQLVKTIGRDGINSSGHFSHWNLTFDKLQMWGLIQFEKIIFLDSDMIILKNIDSLFTCDEFSAVCAGCSYPGNEHWNGLNSGLLVVKPDKNVEKTVIELANVVIDEYKSKNKMIGDQDIIQCFCSDWSKRTTLHLDEGYNLFAFHLTYYVKHLGYSLKGKGKPIYVIHFIGKTKPWMIKGVKKYLWLLWVVAHNPLYFVVYRKYRKLLKSL